MTKTIAQMADAYGTLHRDGYGFRNMRSVEGFEDGANAVLGEIENIVIDNYKDTHNMAVRLIAKIKELKGK